MGQTLKDFLINLASSPELMTQFAADPAAVLAGSGLSADEQAALLARDSDRIRAAIGASVADHLTHVLARRKGARKAVKRKGAKKGARKPAKKKGGSKKR
jgi:hypothetical protein